jgi:mono/diheme cytochrome c family protein
LIRTSFLLAALALSGAALADDDAGAKVFNTRCSVCHGQDASGVPGTFPSLHEQVVSFAKSPDGRDYLVMVVSSGLMGQIKIGEARYNNVMPAQAGLSEEEVAAVLSYLGKSPISADDVKAARARHAANTATTTRTLRPATE